MSKLPVPNQVADEILAYANKLLDDAARDVTWGFDTTVWHPEYGSRMMQNEYKKQALLFGAHGLQNVIDNARAGDDDADKALRDLYAAAKHERIPVPPALEVYTDEFVLRGGRKRKRGRRAAKNAFADVVLAICVQTLLNKFPGLPPTRRESANHERSACDFIALAVSQRRWTGRKLNYKRIEGLWIKFYRPAI